MALKTILVCDGCSVAMEDSKPVEITVRQSDSPAHRVEYDLCPHCHEHMIKVIHTKNWPALPWAPVNPTRGSLRIPTPQLPPKGLIEGSRIRLGIPKE